MPEETVQTGLSDNAASGLAYLFIPAIIFLLTAPYNQKASIRFHCWQSIFLAIAWVVAMVAQLILAFIPIIGWLLMLLIWLTLFIVWLICIVKAFNGQRFNIPLIGDFSAKQAGA